MILHPIESPDRKFVRIRYAARPGEKPRYEKTNIARDTPEPEKSRRLAIAINELQGRLLKGAEIAAADAKTQNGWVWVHPWASAKWGSKKRTLAVYLAHWKKLVQFLAEKKIHGPPDLRRQHGYDYCSWRTERPMGKSRRLPGINSAIAELKFLAQVMDEALAREYVTQNPVRKLGIEAEEHDIKPEIMAEELEIIISALDQKPVWMKRAFLLAVQTGLRHAETRLSRSQVRWASRDILIEKPKGGRGREFAIPIYESIEPMLKEWWATRDPHFWTTPANTLTGLEWSKFFKDLNLPHLCFHCTRVTFITRGMRDGKIPETVMCKMVNHGSTLISRIYQRWTSEDVRRFAAQVPALPGSAAK